jgi:hypothetical protein
MHVLAAGINVREHGAAGRFDSRCEFPFQYKYLSVVSYEAAKPTFTRKI